MNPTLHTVAELKDSVAGILSGMNINTVADLDATLERAVNNVLQRADIPEASGIQNITLYNGVFNYEIDPNVYATDVVDIRPQGGQRPIWDGVVKTGQQQFDRTKGYLANGTMFAFQYENGTPIIRIQSQYPEQSISIDPCTSNNFVAGGSASTPTVDTTTGWQNNTSLRFTLTGSSAGTLTESLSSPLSMSAYQGVGVAFLAVWVPDAADLTSIELKLGSDNSNYSSVTATTPFVGSFVSNTWQLVAFNFYASSTTGTPNWGALDYVQLTFNHTATETNFRIGSLFMSLPCQAQILYQSPAVFVASGTTTASPFITDNSDTIIFNISAYTIYLYECALAVLENTGGGSGDPMYDRITLKLNGNGRNVKGLYEQFTGNNPSQQLRQFGTYYSPRKNWGWGSGQPGGW